MPVFFSNCWSGCPALLYGLTMFFGASLAIFDIHWLLVFLFAGLLLFPIIYISSMRNEVILRIFLAAALGLLSFTFTTHEYQIPRFNESWLNGKAQVTFSSVTHSKTSFGLLWTYKGTLHSFSEINSYRENSIAKNLPFTLSIPAKNNVARPSANYQYILQTRLKEVIPGNYSLSLSKGASWDPKKNVWAFAEWRFNAKTYLRQVIYSAIKDPHAAAFLGGLATGSMDDHQLSFELGRFGLQHLMAISGLHFAILASIAGFLLQLIFPHKISAFLLITLLSAYFLFLGPSPSVIRAWVSITVALMGTVLSKRSNGLNSLGVSLIVMTLIDPFALQNIGFQFSFAVTTAILVWFAPCEKMCQRFFAKRTLSELAEMGGFSQHGYCLLYFLRQALALAIAVNLVAFPMTLFHFHKFPLMSLIYNLFFPFLMSLSMLLLATGLFVSTIFPWLSDQIHAMNEYFTQFLLSFAFNLPKSFDVAFRMDEIHKEGLAIYLMLILALGLFLKFSGKNYPDEEAFIFV
ncbi:MAG: ComEC/Rec2 family competence protein [Parachlamydiaceae bacterium]|nr:ComEC/Rec2 family competence protein [Parachlamydiaceae bacterium]